MSKHHITSRRRIVTNAAASWLGFAGMLAVTFYMAPRLVHGLGEREYGVWALVEAVVAYLALFDLGIGAAVVRFVAKFEETREGEQLNRVFSTSLAIFGVFGVVAFLIVLITGLAWDRPFGVPDDLASDARWMLLLLGLNLAVSLPMGVYDAVLCALGRYPLRTGIQMGILVFRSAALLAILHYGGGLVEIGVAITGFSLLNHLLVAVFAHRVLPNLRFARGLVDRDTFRTIRGYSIWAFVAMVAGKVSFSTDAIVISAFLTPEYIAYFAIAARLTEYCKSALRSATTVLTPTISALDARGDGEGIRRVLINGTRFTLWFILPIEAGLICFGRPFLKLWMGPTIADASYVTLVILSIPLFLAVSQSISGRIFYATGALRGFAALTMGEAVVNLALSLLWVRSFGIVGVALGTTLPNLVVNAIVTLQICRFVDLKTGVYLRRAFLVPALCVAGLSLAWFGLLSALGQPDTWTRLIVTGAIPLSAYAILLLACERDIRGSVFRAIKRMRSRTRRIVDEPISPHFTPGESN